MAKKLTAVTFVKGYKFFNAGETAGFDPVLAKKLVAAGVARYANRPGPKAKPEPEPTEAEAEVTEKPKRRKRAKASK